MKIVEAAEIKTKCYQWLRLVEETGEPILITKNGKPHCMMQPVAAAEKKLFAKQ